MIERHISKLFEAAESYTTRYEKLYPVFIKYLGDKTIDNLGKQVDKALEIFILNEVNNGNPEVNLNYLRQAAVFGVGNFMYSSYPGEDVSFKINDDIVNLTGKRVSAYMHTSLWMKSLFINMLLRSQNGIEELCKTPNEVFENANIKPNEFDISLVNLFKGLFDASANMSTLIKETIEASAPENIEPERQNFIYDITSPVISLVYHLLKNDETSFNEELVSALESHKKFWSQAKRVDDYNGWISIPLLALCSLAVDNKEFKITVESEYIPKWIYQKQF